MPWIVGVAVLFLLITPSVIRSFLLPSPPMPADSIQNRVTWPAVMVILLLSVPLHELLHAVFLPDFGLSRSTTLVVWPRGLRFGVFFDGQLSRRRWLLMRTAPFLVLALVPSIWLASSSGAPDDFALEAFLSLMILLNSVGSGGDLVAVAWVARRIPPGSSLLFRGGRAFWRHRAEGPASP